MTPLELFVLRLNFGHSFLAQKLFFSKWSAYLVISQAGFPIYAFFVHFLHQRFEVFHFKDVFGVSRGFFALGLRTDFFYNVF